MDGNARVVVNVGRDLGVMFDIRRFVTLILHDIRIHRQQKN